ncbi:sensor histidine kinase [Bradyrhizobium lablabi]|nr:sensor histidine kinase [Bradyrhizobium lablabi]
MESLFEPYTRGDRPSQQGLGLGLYIASEIARAHDGTLKVTSTLEGTTFVFEMPRARRTKFQPEQV